MKWSCKTGIASIVKAARFLGLVGDDWEQDRYFPCLDGEFTSQIHEYSVY